jgi:hypothetical protein
MFSAWVAGEVKTRGRKAFFFEKKKQKTFDYLACGLSGSSEARRAKVFCFFFSKKKSFIPFGPRTSEGPQ